MRRPCSPPALPTGVRAAEFSSMVKARSPASNAGASFVPSGGGRPYARRRRGGAAQPVADGRAGGAPGRVEARVARRVTGEDRLAADHGVAGVDAVRRTAGVRADVRAPRVRDRTGIDGPYVGDIGRRQADGELRWRLGESRHLVDELVPGAALAGGLDGAVVPVRRRRLRAAANRGEVPRVVHDHGGWPRRPCSSSRRDGGARSCAPCSPIRTAR